jgi:CBS-domain-containing membrane protein
MAPQTAADIMDREVPRVSRSDEARRVIELLADRDISAIPVIDSEDRVVGIVSESDLVLSEEEADLHLPHFINIMGGIVFVESMKGFEQKLNKAFATKVRDLMTPDPVTVAETDSVDRVARLIAEKHHNHLPVLDADGHLAGLVTRADVLAALVDQE